MCYTSASAAKAGAKEALANGVLILLVPPMVFFAVITVVVYMYRNKFRDRRRLAALARSRVARIARTERRNRDDRGDLVMSSE